MAGDGPGRPCWRLLAVVAALLAVGLAGCGSGPVTAPRPPVGTPPWQPASRVLPDGVGDRGWLAAVDALRSQVVQDQGARLVLVGDSLTSRWITVGSASWRARWEPVGALNLGISGDSTQNVLWRLGRGELAGLHPSRAVLLIGTNDITAGWTPAQVVAGIMAVTGAVRAGLPGTPLLLLALLPRDDTAIHGRDVVQVNELLARTTMPAGVTLADLSAHFANPDGRLDRGLYNRDRLHLSAAGYQVLTDALAPALDRLLPAAATVTH